MTTFGSPEFMALYGEGFDHCKKHFPIGDYSSIFGYIIGMPVIDDFIPMAVIIDWPNITTEIACTQEQYRQYRLDVPSIRDTDVLLHYYIRRNRR